MKNINFLDLEKHIYGFSKKLKICIWFTAVARGFDLWDKQIK